MATLLKAAPISKEIVDQLSKECSKLKEKGVVPNLKVILVGEHPPSVIYTRNKKKFMEGIGAQCEILKLPETVNESEFLSILEQQGKDPEVHGLFVQLPLPKSLSHLDVGQMVPPEKDVDGFHAVNLHGLMAGDSGEKFLIPCTPKGVLTMLRHANVELSGKRVAIIGRSLIVGKPLALLLTNENATVTLCHSRTKDLEAVTKESDIIVAAIGKAKFITKKYLRDSGDQILIDVGINHDDQGNLCGDIDQLETEGHCSILTPVPGGVGKMTIVSLGQNLIAAAKKQSEER